MGIQKWVLGIPLDSSLFYSRESRGIPPPKVNSTTKGKTLRGEGASKGPQPTRTHQHTTMQDGCMDGWMMVGT